MHEQIPVLQDDALVVEEFSETTPIKALGRLVETVSLQAVDTRHIDPTIVTRA